MMRKAEERIAEQELDHVELRVMDAAAMDLVDDTFDGAVATYTISAVPDPVAVLGEMKRVVKPGGRLVILNHFRSEKAVAGRVEDFLAPVCNHLGWSTNLELTPLLARAGLHPDSVASTNLFNGWRLVRCTNRK
jgi:phosphatidylethanolamine/phosphatidyl-N-methylethanolamine N-methyltransferase